MCKPFAPKLEELQSFIQGDIGIAKSIKEAVMASNLAKIQDEKVRASFITANEKVDTTNSGLSSLEKTVISSMTESLKPIKELSLAALELFAKAELFIAKVFGGANPAYIAGSFMELFSAITETKQAAMPEKILVGKYDSTGKWMLSDNSDKGDMFWTDKQWPQIGSLKDLKELRIGKLNVDALDEADRVSFTENLASNVSEEWENTKKEGQIINPQLNYPAALRKRFAEINIKIKGVDYTIDIENDYTISKVVKNNNILIVATIKDSAKDKGPKTFAPNLLRLIPLFFSLVLPVITKKIMPEIQAIKEMLRDIKSFIVTLVTKKLQENFEFMDPAVMSAPAGDPTRDKYYTKDGKFLLAGTSGIELLGFYIGISLDNGILTPVFKKPADGTPEQPIIKFVLDFIKAPIEFIMGVIKAFTDLIKAFSKPASIPGAIVEFITFKWLIELISPEKLLEFIGVKNMEVPFMGTAVIKKQIVLLKDKIAKVKVEYDEINNKFVKVLNEKRAQIEEIQTDVGVKVQKYKDKYQELNDKLEIIKTDALAQQQELNAAQSKMRREKLAKVESEMNKLMLEISSVKKKAQDKIKSMLPSQESIDKLRSKIATYMEQLRSMIGKVLETYKKAIEFLESILNGFVQIPFKLFGLCIEPPKISLGPMVPDLSNLISLPELNLDIVPIPSIA
jgi:hypothetical protein